MIASKARSVVGDEGKNIGLHLVLHSCADRLQVRQVYRPHGG